MGGKMSMSDESASIRIALQEAMRDLWGAPLERPTDTFGCSEAGFCLEKLVLKARLNRPTACNGAMVIGKVFHKELREILKNITYGKAHGLKFWQKPEFEKLAHYTDPRGFAIEGHCDIDLPALDKIIELKTTSHKHFFAEGEFMTNAYILQANAYANIFKRSSWEIWAIYKEFSDLNNEDFVSVISGPTDPKKFADFLDRVFCVFRAIKDGKDLTGPEQGWECRYCTYPEECPYWREQIPQFHKQLPNTKKNLCSTEANEKLFDLFYAKKWMKYDRSERLYVECKPEEAEDSEESK